MCPALIVNKCIGLAFATAARFNKTIVDSLIQHEHGKGCEWGHLEMSADSHLYPPQKVHFED